MYFLDNMTSTVSSCESSCSANCSQLQVKKSDKPISVCSGRRLCCHVKHRTPTVSLCPATSSCLKLNEALWTARSTPDGFFVSLFWPAPVPEKCDMDPREKKERRTKASQVTLSSSSKTNQAASSVLLNNTSSATAANQSGHDPP